MEPVLDLDVESCGDCQALMGMGAVKSLADFAPTNEQGDVERQLRDRIGGLRSRLDSLVSEDVAAFNDLLRQRNVPNVIVQP